MQGFELGKRGDQHVEAFRAEDLRHPRLRALPVRLGGAERSGSRAR